MPCVACTYSRRLLLQAVEKCFAKLEVLRTQLAGNCSRLQNPGNNERLQRAKQLFEEAKAALHRIPSGTVPSLQFVFIMKQSTEQLHSFMLPQLVSYETCSVPSPLIPQCQAATPRPQSRIFLLLPPSIACVRWMLG